jgi:hypothetical protein
MEKLSTNIKDHRDVGLNADYGISTYRLSGSIESHRETVIFDNEDDTFTLAILTYSQDWEERDYDDIFTADSFKECVEYYNKGEVK